MISRVCVLFATWWVFSVLVFGACGPGAVASQGPAGVQPPPRSLIHAPSTSGLDDEPSSGGTPDGDGAVVPADPYARIERLLLTHPEVRWIVADGSGESWSSAIAWEGDRDGVCVFVSEVPPLCFSSADLSTGARFGDAWTQSGEGEESEGVHVLDLGGVVVDPIGRRRAALSSRREVAAGAWRPLISVDPPEFAEPLLGVMVQAGPADVLQIGESDRFQRSLECVRIDGRWACGDETPPGPMGTAEPLSATAIGEGFVAIEYISSDMENGMNSWHRTETYVIIFGRVERRLVPMANLTLGVAELQSRNVGRVDPERAVIEYVFGFDLSVVGPCLRLTRQAHVPRSRGLRNYSFRAPVFVDAPDQIDVDGRGDLDGRGLIGGLPERSSRRRPRAPRLDGLWLFDPERGFSRSGDERCRTHPS